MNGALPNQPSNTAKAPESGVETKGTASSVRAEGSEIITNSTTTGRERIAALLADSVDSGTNENLVS